MHFGTSVPICSLFPNLLQRTSPPRRSINMQSSSEYRWMDFKKKNRAAILWLSLGLPAIFLIAELLGNFTPIERTHMLLGLAVFWGVVFVRLGVRVSNLLCPRCGKLFFGDGGGEQDMRGNVKKWPKNRICYAFFGRCCKNCGLKLYAPP